jgi:two-component system response regulator PilR (NtrC family)
MRILLVEDDECTQEVLTAFLKHLDSNIKVEVAANGDDALRRYHERSYHLVITDNAHPGMFGIELIELILAKNPLQRIILQTGNCGEHIEAFKQKHRAIPLLEKPYPLQQLQDMARTMLNQ